jgi:hypothetical protein
MPLETVTHIADLVPTNPTAADPKSDGDDHLRNIKKAMANDFAGYTGTVVCTGTDGGAANAYTVTPTTVQTSPTYGLRMGVVFSPTAANTGACTLAIGAQAAKALRAVDGTDLVSGDLTVGTVYAAYYNGTEFRLTCPTKNYIDLVRSYASQLAFSTALPNQTGNSGKFITTNGTAASWAWPQNMPRTQRTTATFLLQTDRASLVDITSGTFTVTFDAAATLGAGWYVWLRNSGTGDITLDPNASELIDGLTSYVMYPGEARLIQCDGTSFNSVVVHGFTKTFTSSGTFVKPPGYSQISGLVWSAAGSGAKHSSATYVASGAGGACAPFTFLASAVPSSTSITIGAGGAGATVDGPGSSGGTSSFGTLISVTGGSGGVASNSLPFNIPGGIPYFSSVNQAFSNGSLGNTTGVYDGFLAGAAANGGSTNGSSSVWGGASGGQISNTSGGAAGVSAFAGKGGDANSTTSGGDGTAPAGGGGATRTGTKSGDGARGECRVWGVV